MYMCSRVIAISGLVKKVDDAILFVDTEPAFVKSRTFSLCTAPRPILLDLASENNE